MNQAWIITAAVVVVLLGLAWFLWLHRLSQGERRDDAPPPSRKEPAIGKSEKEAVQAGDEPEAETPSVVEQEPEAELEAEPEPVDTVVTVEDGTPDAEELEAPARAPREEPPPEPMEEVMDEAADDGEPEPREAESEVLSEGIPEDETDEPGAPPPLPERDPAYEAALAAFETELKAGHFSRLDVFAAHAQASKQPGAADIPRSQYFNDVVNKALETRDRFERLLCDEDRERFVNVHSRYLDDVTHETDVEARQGLLNDHLGMLAELRPRGGTATGRES